MEDCVDRALGEVDEPIQASFAADPLRTLNVEFGLKVRAADHLTEQRDDGGTCDGVSFLKDGVILYAATGNRRENFTLAHELGHSLVADIDDIIDWLADQPDAAVALETLCDRLASRLLFPDEIVTRIIGAGPVRARHVAELYQATNASVPACAIALAGRLPTLGAVIVLDQATNVVTYASVHPDPEHGWPTVHPWPRQTLPAAHPLGGLTSGATFTRRSFWATSWGSRADFYIDAYAGDRRTVAVLVDDDLWGVDVFHPQVSRDFDQRPEGTFRCCGVERTVRAWPCVDCGEPYCPTCGKCRCGRRASREALCAGGCGMKYLPHLLEDGRCEECR